MTKSSASIAVLFVALFYIASSALAEPLLKDGQVVIFVGTSGIKNGDVNRHVYNAKASTLGPVKRPERAGLFRVLKNTASQVVFRGPRDTCVLSADHRFKCAKIGSGTWKAR